MEFYILMPNDTEESTQYDKNKLGTSQLAFKKFKRNLGFSILEMMINDVMKYGELLEATRIIDSKGKTYTPDDFLEYIEKNKLVVTN